MRENSSCASRTTQRNAPAILDLLQLVLLERLGVLGEAERVEGAARVDALRRGGTEGGVSAGVFRWGQRCCEDVRAALDTAAPSPHLHGVGLSAAGGLDEGEGHELDGGEGGEVERHRVAEVGDRGARHRPLGGVKPVAVAESLDADDAGLRRKIGRAEMSRCACCVRASTQGGGAAAAQTVPRHGPDRVRANHHERGGERTEPSMAQRAFMSSACEA